MLWLIGRDVMAYWWRLLIDGVASRWSCGGHWYTYMWWLAGEDIPDIPAHLWSFDGSLVEMWWLTDGDLVSIYG